MIGFLQLRTVDSLDPWAKLEIDAATRQLAEYAAAAAGLSVEEWLERAIRRVSPDILAKAEAEASDAVATEDPDSTLGYKALSPAIDTSPVMPLFMATADATDEAPRLRFQVTGFNRWAVMAAGIVVAIVAGVVSAQYLIPDRSRAIHVAIEPAIPADTPSSPAPSAAIPPPVSNAARTDMTVPPSPAAPGPSTEPAPAAPNTTVSLPPTPSASTVSRAIPPALPAKTPPTGPETSSHKPVPAKPPAAAGVATARTSPSTTSPDGTASDDKAEAPSDPQHLAPWLEARAQTGDPLAQYRLGVLYALGEGVTQDYQRASALFKTAAEAGVSEAEYNLAVMYAEGLGIGRDPKQAV
jgi:hypothetical protein